MSNDKTKERKKKTNGERKKERIRDYKDRKNG